MDSQTTSNSTISSDSKQKRKQLVVLIAILAIIATSWVIYKEISSLQQAQQNTDAQKSAILSQILKDSAPVPDKVKTPLLSSIAKQTAEMQKKADKAGVDPKAVQATRDAILKALAGAR